VKVIEKLFAAFGILFETNDKYWAKMVRYFGDVESKEKRLKEFELQKLLNGGQSLKMNVSSGDLMG
jgi:hypothetical protein